MLHGRAAAKSYHIQFLQYRGAVDGRTDVASPAAFFSMAMWK